MSDEGVTCRYVYTEAEYKTAMRGKSSYKPSLWGLGVIFIGVIGSVVYNLFFTTSPVPVSFMSRVSDLLPLLFVMGFVVWLFLRQPRRVFRKGSLCNLEIFIGCLLEGVHQKQCPP